MPLRRGRPHHHVTAVLSDEAGHGPSQRDGHIALIEAKGRLEWQKATGYGRRSLVETTIGRYKRIIGPQLRARSFAGQQTEAAIGVAVLNRKLEAGPFLQENRMIWAIKPKLRS